MTFLLPLSIGNWFGMTAHELSSLPPFLHSSLSPCFHHYRYWKWAVFLDSEFWLSLDRACWIEWMANIPIAILVIFYWNLYSTFCFIKANLNAVVWLEYKLMHEWIKWKIKWILLWFRIDIKINKYVLDCGLWPVLFHYFFSCVLILAKNSKTKRKIVCFQ